MIARVGAWLLLLASLAAVGGGAWLGITLGERASEADVRALTFRDPLQLEGTPPFAVRSAGGFTGFGGPPVLDGDVLRAGSVTAADEGSLTFEDGAGEIVVTYREASLVFRILAAARPLEGGDSVLIRSVDGVPTSILRIVSSATAEAARAPSSP